MKMNIIGLRFLYFTALLSLLACLALLSTRGYHAISLAEPMQGQTRGAEYESLFPIWKVTQGHALYTQITQIPYTGTYYNWLYYSFYAGISFLVQAGLSLGDTWLPTITRITTLVGSITGTVIFYLALSSVLPPSKGPMKVVTASLAASVFLGPLTGYFAIATTPDIWPMVGAVGALWLFVKFYDSHPLHTVIGICVISYLSWAFKQNFIYIPATIGLFLILRQDWRHALLLSLIMVFAGGVTMIIGGDEYRKMLFFGDTKISLTFEQFRINLINTVVKTAPVLAAMTALVWLAISEKPLREFSVQVIHNRSLLILPFLGTIIAAFEAIPTSAIVAAAENHYFHMILFATVASISAIQSGDLLIKPAVWVPLSVGFILNTVAISTVFLGLQGSLSVRPLHDLLANQNKCLKNLSPSIFVDDPRLMLPWMVSANDHFVMEFSYEWDRKKGVQFEKGGVGGLIDAGYFEHIAILKWRGRNFDGSNLSQYPIFIKNCHGLMVYGKAHSP
ncbi:MAG: hypothetical protein CBB68_06430 [Rhodospirillaceae bacterium TMED8]|nr:hypothetical protein [Magnetovibrio sp.]OUT51252.1 MAG: hypothetical protein CBB68_06430 [Rhodospirillaceae bacterium TMED8]|tara:strand:- start:1142 stop:2659 length:1518 start_codon:yes stop_codon:yes gene_type:complete